MGIVPHPAVSVAPGLFKVVTLRPQSVKDIGPVGAGVDVTEQLGTFKHLQSLVDQGVVMIVPVAQTSDIPLATKAAEAPVEETAADTGADAESESPTAQAEPNVGDDDGDGDDAETDTEDDEQTEDDDYMEDPTGFTVKEVVAYAEAHPEHVAMLLEMESEGKNRTGIVGALTDMLGAE